MSGTVNGERRQEPAWVQGVRHAARLGVARSHIEAARCSLMSLYGGNLDHPALDHLEAALVALDATEVPLSGG